MKTSSNHAKNTGRTIAASKTSPRPKRLPVTVLSGFPGAEKTTPINHVRHACQFVANVAQPFAHKTVPTREDAR